MNGMRSSSSATVVPTPLPAVNIRNSAPAPDQWTLVREYNIEKRDDFTDWQQRLSVHLQQMHGQLLSYNEFIGMMDHQIEETKKGFATQDCVDMTNTTVNKT